MNNIVFMFDIWLTEFLHSLAMFYLFGTSGKKYQVVPGHQQAAAYSGKEATALLMHVSMWPYIVAFIEDSVYIFNAF